MASQTDLASLKFKVGNLDPDNLKIIPVDLIKISNAVNNNVLKKTVYDKLVINVDAIDTKIPTTSGLVTKTRYDSDKQSLEKNIEDAGKKIPYTSGLIKKADCTEKLQRLKIRYLMLLDRDYCCFQYKSQKR